MTKLTRSLPDNLRLRQKYKLETPIKVATRYSCRDYIKQLGQVPRQEKQPLSCDILSRSRPEKEAELMGNCCESKMRLRQNGEK